MKALMISKLAMVAIAAVILAVQAMALEARETGSYRAKERIEAGHRSEP